MALLVRKAVRVAKSPVISSREDLPEIVNNVQVDFVGEILVPSTGEYAFSVQSDDGTELEIDGKRVLADASLSVAEALKHLRAGEDVSTQLIEIHRLENEGDRISREAIASRSAGCRKTASATVACPAARQSIAASARLA